MIKRIKKWFCSDTLKLEAKLKAAEKSKELIYDIYQTTVNNRPINSVRLLKFSKKVKEKSTMCYICGTEENLTVHHIYPKSIHPSLTYTVDNGVCMCQKCHQDYHKTYSDLLEVGPSSLLKFEKDYTNDHTNTSCRES